MANHQDTDHQTWIRDLIAQAEAYQPKPVHRPAIGVRIPKPDVAPSRDNDGQFAPDSNVVSMSQPDADGLVTIRLRENVAG